MHNILFICSRNQWRSPTAEAMFRQHPAINARSAGTSRDAKRPVTLADIQWANTIFVMEEKHKNRLQATFPRALQYKTPLVLHIPDDYRYMDPALVQILNERLAPYLAQITDE